MLAGGALGSVLPMRRVDFSARLKMYWVPSASVIVNPPVLEIIRSVGSNGTIPFPGII